MVCLRNISVDTLHKGDTEDDNNNNNNNNNNNIKTAQTGCYSGNTLQSIRETSGPIHRRITVCSEVRHVFTQSCTPVRQKIISFQILSNSSFMKSSYHSTLCQSQKLTASYNKRSKSK